MTSEQAERFARVALGHVGREFPNGLQHVWAGPGDGGGPRALHPVFFGSFDWHSCVHAYWMLAHLLRRFPDMGCAIEIRALFDARLTANGVAGECAYFARSTARGFERPYGWAWLLKLAEALRAFPDGRWASALAPLAAVMVERFRAFLPKAPYPVRVGTHFNTAFALRLAADFAADDEGLLGLLRETALGWYGNDAGCHAWEPSMDEFLSSALMEAECMRRLLPADAFEPWFGRFLPDLAAGQPATLFTPPQVTDRSDGKIAHLDGLSFSRAWCFRALAAALPPGDARVEPILAAADAHLAAALPHVAGDYMGEHWLATFAVLALDM